MGYGVNYVARRIHLSLFASGGAETIAVSCLSPKRRFKKKRQFRCLALRHCHCLVLSVARYGGER